MTTTPLLAGSFFAESLPATRPRKIEEAASQFESILLAQMLRSVRESAASIGADEEGDSESSSMLEVAEQQFARMLAQQGGLGLRGLITSGLESGEGKD
jgi:Rod binding domain-containing protein